MSKEGTTDNNCVSDTSKGKWWEQEAMEYKAGCMAIGMTVGRDIFS